MSDDKIPAIPPVIAPIIAPVAAAPLTIGDKLKLDLKTLWNEYRGFLIGFGILILIVKGRDLIIDILVNSGKSEITAAGKEDAKLANQENQANQAADALVQKSKDEPLNNKPVDENWNVKK